MSVHKTVNGSSNSQDVTPCPSVAIPDKLCAISCSRFQLTLKPHSLMCFYIVTSGPSGDSGAARQCFLGYGFNATVKVVGLVTQRRVHSQ